MKTIEQPIRLIGHETLMEISVKVLSIVLTKYDTGELDKDHPTRVTIPGHLSQDFNSSYELACTLGKGVLCRDDENKSKMSDVDTLIHLAVECRWPRVIDKKYFKCSTEDIDRDCTAWSNQYLTQARRVADGDVIFSTLPHTYTATMQ